MWDYLQMLQNIHFWQFMLAEHFSFVIASEVPLPNGRVCVCVYSKGFVYVKDVLRLHPIIYSKMYANTYKASRLELKW